jgi:transcriptional regulator with XRE-family HTH domain
MRLEDLRTERLRRGWNQTEVARRLRVSQPYLNMLENKKRRLTPALERRFVSVYGLSAAVLPEPEVFKPTRKMDAQRLAEHLAGLGYPGFAYLRSHVRKQNPGEVLLTALAQECLEARVAEGLPWLLLQYWQMGSEWLVEQAKKFDLQNRLGFVVALARQLSERTPQSTRTNALSALEALLDRSRLAREDAFFRPPRNNAEREWLTENRPEEARHWNLLSDLRPEHLQYAG